MLLGPMHLLLHQKVCAISQQHQSAPVQPTVAGNKQTVLRPART